METEKKKGRYQRLFKQLNDLLPKGNTPTARMATINAVLYHKLDYFYWCGFYFLENKQLNVGPYQGPLACLELEKDTGVCWASINEENPIIVPNVEEFPGHISCDSNTSSEMVIPIRDKANKIIGVFDVDSKKLNAFDDVDIQGLSKILELINL